MRKIWGSNVAFFLFILVFSSLHADGLERLKAALGSLKASVVQLSQSLSQVSGKLSLLKSKLEKLSGKTAQVEDTLLASSLLGLVKCSKEVSKKLEYTINLMWINEKLDEKQNYIMSSVKDEKELHEKFLNRLFEWAAKNPESVVNLWFDGEKTLQQAVGNTWQVIEKRCEKNPAIAPIMLRDIRALPTVQKEKSIEVVKKNVKNNEVEYEVEMQVGNVFSDERFPVYFYADLLRLVATYDVLQNGETDCFVYTDFTVETLIKAELFDVETKKNLDQYGIVMAYGSYNSETGLYTKGYLGFENAFHMMTRHENLLKAVKFALIDLCIARVRWIQQSSYFYPQLANESLQDSPRDLSYVRQTSIKFVREHIQQSVYDCFPNMFRYFYALDAKSKGKSVRFMMRPPEIGTVVEYNEEQYGLRPFGIEMESNGIFSHFDCNLEDSASDYTDAPKVKPGKPVMRYPTKKVKRPPSHFGVG